MILYVRRTRYGIDARRMAKDLVLSTQGGCGVLHDHETRVQPAVFSKKRGQDVSVRCFISQPHDPALRDVAKFRQSHCKIIEGHRQWLAVKVSAAYNVYRTVVVLENQRII